MSFARNILRDLVDRKLWPIALLMVIAIVAIPVLLGGGSKTAADEESLPVAPATAANASSAVELLGPPSVRKRAGKVVDPFRRRKAAEPNSTTTTTPAEDTSSAGTTAPGTGGAAAPQKSAPSPFVYRTTVRFGASDSAKARRISRLTPLGSLLDPAALFLGIEADGKHALFLLGADTKSVGEASCREKTCRVISLSVGETQILDVTPKDAAPAQFELKVTKIKHQKLATATKAAGARAYRHPDGVDVLRLILEDEATATAVTGFGYNRDRGIVMQVADTPTTSGG
jgi:hypothetical protein